jgi:hypothetical protein
MTMPLSPETTRGRHPGALVSMPGAGAPVSMLRAGMPGGRA